MRKYILTFMAVSLLSLTSCVTDEGNETLSTINELTVSGIESEYNVVTHSERLTINPSIEGTLSNADESNLEFEWFLCNDGVGAKHQHTTIGTEKQLNYPVEAAPANYHLYLAVKDKTTGLKWETVTKLNIISPFVRGLYLFGDKADGTVGLDFVSMINGRDDMVINDIMENSVNAKGAKNLIFTGYYAPNDAINQLWAITSTGSYKLENSSSLNSFKVLEKESNADGFIFPTVNVTRPMKVMDIQPHSLGSNNTCLNNSNRLMMTEHEIYYSSVIAGESYGNPITRYSGSTDELFQPSPYVFYPGNSTYLRAYLFYDETNNCFVGLNSSFGASYLKVIKETSGTPFYFDQNQYPKVRHLVYGSNGYGNNGRSYALMNDEDGAYYIYAFHVDSYSSMSKQYERTIDMAVATDFDKASMYAFYSMQSVILYAVGSKLYAYDYSRNALELVKDFGADITYLAMDYNTDDNANDFVVATYSDSEKGTVRRFALNDDQNSIAVTPYEKDVWKTNLKVVKVEYRNAAN